MGLTRIRAEQISNIDYKQAVRVVTTTNITNLSGGTPASVDGISLIAGDRILVAGQSTGSQNGLYYVATLGTGSNGTWTRTSDGNETGEIEAGMVVMVTEGATYADTPWKLTTNGPIVIGVTALTFSQFSSGSGTPGGSNTQIQFNSSNTFAGSSSLTWNGSQLYVDGAANVTGNVTGAYFVGNGSQLTGISTSTSKIFNGTSNVDIGSADANVTVSVNGTSNVAVFSTSGLAVTGNITGNGIPTTTVSDTAPANPAQGDIWIVGNTGVQLIYFTSGGNSQWAEMEAATNIVIGDYGDANVLAYLSNGVAGNIIPSANITYNLGSSTNRWNDIWLANSTIYLGSAQISADGSSIVLPANTVVGGNPVVVENGGSSEFTANVTAGNLISQGVISAIGNITGSYIIGNGSQLTGLPAGYTDANVVTLLSGFGSNTITTTGNITSGNLSGTNVTGTLLTASQPNITSVGTLGSLTVTGNVSSGNLSGTNIAGTLTTAAQPNITSVGSLTSLSVTGNASTGNVSGTTGTFTNVAGTLTTAAQTNITSVGTLTGLTVSGSSTLAGFTLTGNTISSSGTTMTLDPATAGVNGLVVIAGNLQVNGTTTTIDSTTITINDLVFTVANNAATSAAANGGGLEVGPAGSPYASWTYDQPNSRWSTSLGVNATGNITGGNLSGTNVTGTLATAAQPNITSVGTLSSLTVTGNVSTGNVSGTTGTFTNVAGTLTTAAQTNITSVGSLGSLTVTGNVTSGNVSVSGLVKFGDNTTQTTAGISSARSVALNMILG